MKSLACQIEMQEDGEVSPVGSTMEASLVFITARLLLSQPRWRSFVRIEMVPSLWCRSMTTTRTKGISLVSERSIKRLDDAPAMNR